MECLPRPPVTMRLTDARLSSKIAARHSMAVPGHGIPSVHLLTFGWHGPIAEPARRLLQGKSCLVFSNPRSRRDKVVVHWLVSAWSVCCCTIRELQYIPDQNLNVFSNTIW